MFTLNNFGNVINDDIDYILLPRIIITIKWKSKANILVDSRNIFEQLPFNSMNHDLLNSRLEALLDSLFLHIISLASPRFYSKPFPPVHRRQMRCRLGHLFAMQLPWKCDIQRARFPSCRQSTKSLLRLIFLRTWNLNQTDTRMIN